MNITKHIPNFITCLNLFAGCVSCVMAFQGEYLSAAFFLYLAAAFDFLDGMMARLLNAYSKIGKELDSLSDVVSFGVAPGVMLFSWLQTIAPERLLLPYLAFLIPVSSALRLATFNIDDRQATAFIGLPTPANAIFITSLISYVSLLEEPNFLSGILSNVWIIILLIVVLSFLLNSNLPMFSLKFKNLTWRDNKTCYIFLVLSLALLVIFQLAAIPLIIVLFILMSLLLHLKK